MPPDKPPVPAAVLAALGLIACEPKEEVFTACLDFPVETGEPPTPTPTDTFGPCLDFPVETGIQETDLPDSGETDDSLYDTSTHTGDTGGDTGVTPCLDFPVDTNTVGPCLDFPVDTAETDMVETDIGPCLDFPVDTADTVETDIGPCLSPPQDTFGPCLDFPAPDTGDTDIGPCLSPPAPTPPPAPVAPDSDASAQGRDRAIRQVIDDLPADLQEALRVILNDDQDA